MTAVCDLILLSWNHLEQTRPCLESLFETVDVPSRLLIVDNGSEPAVRAFLASVAPRGQVTEVALLQNERNEGFPRGMNLGLRASTAPFVCLLNNDLRFTPGWLSEMIRVAEADDSIGLVNPASNTFGHRPAPGASWEAYVADRRRHRGETSEIGESIGFCLLIPRRVRERVGDLSEAVERVFFEDEDYSMRVQRAGFRCVVAEGAYVHHAEHQSVKRLADRDALFARNQRWCNETWGRRIRIAWPRFSPAEAGSEDLRPWLEELLRWARQRTHVYVYAPGTPREAVAALFRSVGLQPHSDIHWHPVPQRLAAAAALWAILRRQKKPFDVIVAPGPRWERLARRLRWLHRADVVPESEPARLVSAWQTKSHSPS
jgi:GT2 family glycosyltransferase